MEQTHKYQDNPFNPCSTHACLMFPTSPPWFPPSALDLRRFTHRATTFSIVQISVHFIIETCLVSLSFSLAAHTQHQAPYVKTITNSFLRLNNAQPIEQFRCNCLNPLSFQIFHVRHTYVQLPIHVNYGPRSHLSTILDMCSSL